MPRYFVRRHGKGPSQRVTGWYDDDAPLLPALYVPDHKAAETGLLDKNGDPIMRAPNKMGFHWGDE